LDCSSFEIANPRLHILFEHDPRANGFVSVARKTGDPIFPIMLLGGAGLYQSGQ